jgi:hypothetical protein
LQKAKSGTIKNGTSPEAPEAIGAGCCEYKAMIVPISEHGRLKRRRQSAQVRQVAGAAASLEFQHQGAEPVLSSPNGKVEVVSEPRGFSRADGRFRHTHFLVVSDQDRSRELYRSVFDGQVLLERDPVAMKVANTWLILNVGGGPTDDKPSVILITPPDPNRSSAFLNIRVADIDKLSELERCGYPSRRDRTWLIRCGRWPRWLLV